MTMIFLPSLAFLVLLVGMRLRRWCRENGSCFTLRLGFWIPFGRVVIVDDDAAAASFFVLVGAAGFSASSKAGVVLVEVNEILTARSLSFSSPSCFPRAM